VYACIGVCVGAGCSVRAVDSGNAVGESVRVRVVDEKPMLMREVKCVQVEMWSVRG
jgi:hypothetical protein